MTVNDGQKGRHKGLMNKQILIKVGTVVLIAVLMMIYVKVR